MSDKKNDEKGDKKETASQEQFKMSASSATPVKSEKVEIVAIWKRQPVNGFWLIRDKASDELEYYRIVPIEQHRQPFKDGEKIEKSVFDKYQKPTDFSNAVLAAMPEIESIVAALWEAGFVNSATLTPETSKRLSSVVSKHGLRVRSLINVINPKK